MSTDELLGTVAVVGFPNVGKSTLVNRLTASRQAVVHETPGVTRDRKEVVCEWAGQRFLLVDTGGVDVADPSPLTQQVAEQARRAIAEADLVLFVLDTRAGITPGDEELAAILRHSRKPIFLIANKIDEPGREAEAFEFHRLGLGDPIPISSVHGHGTGDLLDAIVARLPGSGPAEAGEEAIRVAILGRPNVGKSSLLNALLGEERVIVSEQPGTTRDAIDTVLRRGDQTFVLVDTAGIRRKRKQRQGIEYYSQLRALQAAERADVALVLVDASEGVVEQDLAIADIARKSMSSTLVVLSKWDIAEVGIEDTRERLEPRLRQRPPVLAASAKTHRGVGKLLDRIELLYGKYTARVPTGELNRFLQELREVRQPPSRNGKRLNLLYGTQTTVRPPRFRFFVNDPGLITRDYGYWVENQLREKFDLEGIPVAIDFVRRPQRGLSAKRTGEGVRGNREVPRGPMRAVVVGAGAWGTAFARVLAERGHDVTLAARDPEQARAIAETGRNPRYLSDVSLDGIGAASLAEAPLAGADLTVLAVPSRAFAEVVAALPANGPVLSLTKGLDPATANRLSTLLGGRPVAVLSGPNFAEEIGHGLPAAAVIASDDVELAERLQQELNSLIFRVYVNSDVIGVELAAASKNVIALAAGGVDGLGLGDNAKSGIVTRGLAEMARLGLASGARNETFSGLAGNRRPHRHVLVAPRPKSPGGRADRARRLRRGRRRGDRNG